MNRAHRTLTPDQVEAVMQTANEVARRRRALDMTQVQLDQACGFTFRTTDAIERATISHRSMLPSDPRVGKVLATLAKLEADPDWKPEARGPAHRSRTSPRAKRARPNPSPHSESQTLCATLVRCPDQDIWITQAGCDSIKKTNLVCKSLRLGFGCKGVRYRKKLERKEIAVQYTPPKPETTEPKKLHFEDWV